MTAARTTKTKRAASRTAKVAKAKPRAPHTIAVDPAAEVARAAAAIEAGDFAAALAALVLAWRAVADPALADAIALVGERAGRAAASPATEKAWLAAAAQDDPVARAGLYRTVWDGDPRVRFLALAAHPDPRTAALVVEYLCKPAVGAFRRFATEQRPVFAALGALGDPRAIAHADRIVRAWATGVRIAGITDRVKLLVAKATGALAVRARATLPAAAATTVRKILADPRLADTGAADDAALRAAVYADPDVDGPRAIYADWLQQRGDPRGEFIALQLAGGEANLERAAALLAPREKAWLGSLAGSLQDVTWARGFPVTGTILPGPPRDPAWATFEAISGALPPDAATAMPRLCDVELAWLEDLAHLARLAPPPARLAAVGMYDSACTPQALAELRSIIRTLRLPALRRLELLVFDEEDPALAADALADLVAIGPLTELTVACAFDGLADWIVAAAPTSLEMLVLKTPTGALACTRDASGRLARLASTRSTRLDQRLYVEQLATSLEQLPPASLTDVAICVKPAAWTPALRARIARAIARQPGVTPRFPSDSR